MPFGDYSGTKSGGTSRWGGSSSDSGNNFSVDPIEKQIANTNMRIQDAGYTPQDTDTRNWFEKLTNLPQGQNGFLDTLELLGRSGSAIKNVIDKTVLQNTNDNSVENPLTAAWRGFSGQDRVTGADLADKMGYKNGVGKFVVGTGLDIGTDPTSYIPAGLIAKGISSIAKPVGGLAKGAYDALETASPAIKSFRTNTAEPAFNAAKDALGRAFVPQHKWDETLTGGTDETLKTLFRDTNNTRDFMNENALQDTANTAKTTGIDAGPDVGRLAEKDLRQFQDVKGYEFPDGVTRTENKGDLLDAANTNREQIRSLGKEVNATRREYDTAISQTAQRLEKTNKTLSRMLESERNKKLKTLVKGDPAQIADKPVVRKGFLPNSPALNLLMKRGDEVNAEISATRKELGLPKVRKKSYTPEQMDQLSTSRAFKSLSPSPSFNYLVQHRDELKGQLDMLREQSKTARGDKITQIKNLVSDTESLKEASKNPVMIQKEVPRIQREMPTDPAVLDATKKIVESNDNLRQWATENDIPIGEIEGYMKHILSQEERELRKVNPKAVDRSMSTMNNPDKKVLNPRKLMGSVEDVNDKMGRKFFEPNAYFATAIGQKKLIDYGTSVKFRRDILSKPDFAKPFKEGMSVSDQHELIDTNNYTFMKNDGNSLPEQIGGKYIVTKGVKEALDRYQGLATDEGTKGMIKAFDALQNTWKKMALFSPGFHIRNFAGAVFNNIVAGMNPYNLVKYTKEAAGEVANAVKGNESALFREYRAQGLGSSNLSKVEFASMGQEPEAALLKTVENMSKTGKAKIISKLKSPFQTSREIGDTTDQVNRFALYKWARESKKMTPEQAAKKVKEVQYDYSELTPFERNVMKRVIPFYTWSRKNIPFQLKSFVNDPRPYLAMDKISKNAQSTAGLDENNMPNFMKENFSIPVTKSQMLGLNLPLSDLTKLMHPLKTITDGLSPIPKTILEESLNYNFFKGKPIEKFAGQDKKYLGGVAIPAKLDYAIQAATGQIGKGLSGYLGDAGNVSQDNKFRTPSLGLSVVKPYDAEKSAYYQKLDELKQLQDYLLYIQQQTGEKPRTTAEIKKSGSSRW